MNVSVIIPAFNAAETIADTLTSLLAQTHHDWEGIVVDDGSTDATADVVRRFAQHDARIRLLQQANAGESAARNTGLAVARFDWLLFLDADDWIASEHLERMTAELRANPHLDAVHCRWARVTRGGELIVEPFVPPTGDMFAIWAKRSAFPVHACVIRRAPVQSVGNFDVTLRRSADWDLWQRVARTGALFGAVPDLLAYYRVRPQGASLDATFMLEDGLRVIERGHAADPRVANPDPKHAHGAPPHEAMRQRLYLLAWCAGLVLGRGEDARPLLALIGDSHCADLFPDAIAECIFGAAILPASAPPDEWEQLWPRVHAAIDAFLVALEAQSTTPALARNARDKLLLMILKHSPAWRPILEQIASARGDGLAEGAALERASARVEAESLRGALEQERIRWLAEHDEQVDEAKRARIAYAAPLDEITAERDMQQARVQQISATSRALLTSPERLVGDLLLNRLRLRGAFLAVARLVSVVSWQLTLLRLRWERGRAEPSRRLMATICWNFPIYSQTFVYQELSQLVKQGYTLRVVYSLLDPRDQLGPQFDHLWRLKRRLFLNRTTHERDFLFYQRKIPERVESLIVKLCEASGQSRADLVAHSNFLEAFSFTRMVEAYQPAYLHSYFFYDRSLMALIAAFLLDLPRGITCYADHVLDDYELKVVRLHLELADVVVATSARIKRELLEIAPGVDTNRIIVKPNGIDTDYFRHVERYAPADGQPFRVVAVNRIEPKKGSIYLVEAIGILRKRGHAIEAHVVGVPDEWSPASLACKRQLDSRISALGLGDAVHLEGRQNSDGVRRFLGIAHLYSAPFVETESGDKDGIPTSLLEAMSTGLPCVATDAGSIPEVIAHQTNGLLVTQRDPMALANAIESLLLDPRRRAEFGSEASITVRRRFDASTCEREFHDRLVALRRDRHAR